jgi:Initiation factor 2 subunit family
MTLNEIDKALLVWGPVPDEAVAHIHSTGWLVVVPEGRPFMTGLKQNIQKLKKAGIKFVYVNDNSLGSLFNKGKISRTIIFYKGKNDKEIRGFCGTMYVAILSRLHNVKIELIPAKDLSPEGSVEMLGGKKYILRDNVKDFIVAAEDEIVDLEVLQ